MNVESLNIYDITEENFDKKEEDFVPLSEVLCMLDNIESKVMDIKYMLEQIKGLDYIDEIKELTEKLEKDLY